MKKRILAAALAVCMAFGTAAALPQGALDGGFGFTVSAATSDCDFTTQTLSDGTLEITGYKGRGGTVVVPSKIGGKKVTKIGDTAFKIIENYNISPTKIIIPEGITDIGQIVFYWCDKLESVELPSTLRNMYTDVPAFYICRSLKEIKVADGCKNYSAYDGVLYNKDRSKLLYCPEAKTSVTIYNGVKQIGDQAFMYSQIKSVTLPQTLKVISQQAFKECKNLRTIKIPSSVESIGLKAFDSGENLESINVDSKNTNYWSFDGVLCDKYSQLIQCPTKKKSLNVPSTVNTISYGSCAHTKLESVTMSDSVKEIGSQAFEGCRSLQSVQLSKNLGSIGDYAFTDCTALGKISIPVGVKTIERGAFQGCTSLTSAEMRYGVKDINAYAFFDCTKLKNLTIPKSVSRIGDQAIGFYCSDIDWATNYKKVSGFTIHGVETSEAQFYAKVKGFDFVAEVESVRLAGKNRYDTAAVIAHNVKNRSSVVILASGEGYADALAGVPLARYLGAPILLTPKNSLSQQALFQIRNRKATKVVILGGEGAVGKDVEDALKKEGLTTVRVAGSNRYGTAVEIAKNMKDAPTEVFFAYAGGFADALSAGPAAAQKGAPILHLGKDGGLNAETKAYLEQLRKKGCVKNAYVIGGTGVISDPMMKKAAAMLGLKSGTTVQRIAGENRYETCLEVNGKLGDSFSGEMICFSTGLDFPDALAGGVFAAENRSPIMLTDKKLNDQQKKVLRSRSQTVLVAFGGEGAVSAELLGSICKAVK